MTTSYRLSHFAMMLAVVLLAAVVGCESSSDTSQSLLGDVFGGLIPPTPTQAALDMLDMDDPDNRRRGLALIAGSPFGGEEVYLRVYRTLINDPDPTVRTMSARALGMHGGPDDAILLAALINNRVEEVVEIDGRSTVVRYNEADALVRWEAAIALQRIHNPAVVDALIAAVLRDSDADVRSAAAAAMGQYPTPAVFDPLLSALTDPQFRVVREARGALTTLTGYDLGPDPEAWFAYRRLNADNLFADRQLYTYQPWVAPPGFASRLKFWTRPARERAEGQVPAGM